MAIGKRKRQNIVKSGCSVVSTDCPARTLQVTDMLSHGGDRFEVKYVEYMIGIYAESLD